MMVTLDPNRANACPISTPTAPPPRTASEPGSSRGSTAWRLVQNFTASSPARGLRRPPLPPAIASPATPPPRHTTSNSCGNLITSHRARAAQRFQQRRGRERTEVAVVFEDGGALCGARQGRCESLGEAAAQRDTRLVGPWPPGRMVEGKRVDGDHRHPPHDPLATKELGDIRARGPREDGVGRVVLGDLRLHLEKADAVSG